MLMNINIIMSKKYKVGIKMTNDTIGYRYTIAEAKIIGNNIVGRFYVYSTPVGLFMFAQIDENEEFGDEREILRLKIKPKIKNNCIERLNTYIPLIYIKNRKGWLRFASAQVTVSDLAGGTVEIFKLHSDLDLQAEEMVGEGKIAYTVSEKESEYKLNHA